MIHKRLMQTRALAALAALLPWVRIAKLAKLQVYLQETRALRSLPRGHCRSGAPYCMNGLVESVSVPIIKWHGYQMQVVYKNDRKGGRWIAIYIGGLKRYPVPTYRPVISRKPLQLLSQS